MVFSEPPGSYDICPICRWEDDQVQLRFPLLTGGANKESLYQHQLGWIIQIPLEIQEKDGRKRDPQWRLLNNQDLEILNGSPSTGQEYFEAAAMDSPPYYWR